MEATITIQKNQSIWAKLSKGVLYLLCFVLAMTAVVSVTNAKLTSLRSATTPEYMTAAVRTKQLDCLSRNIYYEAANEPFEGKVAVAQVTLNRVSSGKFADDVCGVVYQRNTIVSKIVCQFSWFCDNTARVKPIHPAQYKESEEVAKKVLLENFRLPGLTEALYYHASYVNPGWNKEKIATIGHHIFYK